MEERTGETEAHQRKDIFLQTSSPNNHPHLNGYSVESPSELPLPSIEICNQMRKDNIVRLGSSKESAQRRDSEQKRSFDRGGRGGEERREMSLHDRLQLE